MALTGSAEKRRWRMGAYVARAFAALPQVKSVTHRVTVDGAARELRAAMVLVANCGELIPPFLRLRHDIAPDDGWLDVLALRADGALESVTAFLALVRGPANGSRQLWFGRGRDGRVAVLEGPSAPVQLDGEVTGAAPFQVRLVPGALRAPVEPATASQGSDRRRRQAAATARGLEKVHLSRQYALLRERDHQGEKPESLGVSPGMQELARQITLLAASERTTVLLTGESGTGKGWVARLVHRLSPRASAAFVEVNCGGLSATFLESELFGHEKGAFTDAKERKLGLFELADGGTIFLDEIGDLAPELQPKLLRVLETKTFRRLGGTRELTVDLRLVAATSRELASDVQAARVRQDP